jgi:hypothetical protein
MPTHSEPGAAQRAVAQALDAIRRARKEAAAIIDATDDPKEAFDAASALAEGIKAEVAEAAAYRGQTVRRLWKDPERGMKLELLAEQTGRTKQRLSQLAKLAEPNRKEQEDP